MRLTLQNGTNVVWIQGVLLETKKCFFLENFDRSFQFSYKENIEVVKVKYFAAFRFKVLCSFELPAGA